MSRKETETVAGEVLSGQKAVWRQPTVTVLEAWEAQAKDVMGTDGNAFIS
jgi:hypothetical protein